MRAKRKLTNQFITRKAQAAFKKHGPNLSLHQFAQLSGLSVGIVQLRLGPWQQQSMPPPPLKLTPSEAPP